MANTPNPNNYYQEDFEDLILNQFNKWPLFKSNFSLMSEAFEKSSDQFMIEPSTWKIDYFNISYRVASATADVDKAIAGERPCFLCRDNRPVEQLNIIRDGYELLLNPYPISVPHLTLPAIEHRPQLITPEAIRQMSRFTRMLDDMAIFYNGPRCGASAPDHFHFQAVHKSIAGNYSVRTQAGVPLRLSTVGKSSLNICVRELSPYTYLHIISKKDTELLQLFSRAWEALPAAHPEPMVNIIAWKSKFGTEMVIVPRRAHRPQCYGTGPDQFLISPACSELMGWFPLARREDFDRFTPEVAQSIYDDVCLDDEQTDMLYNNLKS